MARYRSSAPRSYPRLRVRETVRKRSGSNDLSVSSVIVQRRSALVPRSRGNRRFGVRSRSVAGEAYRVRPRVARARARARVSVVYFRVVAARHLEAVLLFRVSSIFGNLEPPLALSAIFARLCPRPRSRFSARDPLFSEPSSSGNESQGRRARRRLGLAPRVHTQSI